MPVKKRKQGRTPEDQPRTIQSREEAEQIKLRRLWEAEQKKYRDVPRLNGLHAGDCDTPAKLIGWIKHYLDARWMSATYDLDDGKSCRANLRFGYELAERIKASHPDTSKLPILSEDPVHDCKRLLQWAESASTGDNVHSPDFTSVRWNGVKYEFAVGNQSQVVGVLWKQWEDGQLAVAEATIAQLIKSSADKFRVAMTFRIRGADGKIAKHPAMGAMIVSRGKGKFGLFSPK